MNAKRKNVAKFEVAGTSEPPANMPRGLTISQALNATFDTTVAQKFPEEYADESDRKILRAVWMLATRQAIAHIGASVMVPMDGAAREIFDSMVPPPAP
jgi:hypothetical protein